jgi:hypothetical protein
MGTLAYLYLLLGTFTCITMGLLRIDGEREAVNHERPGFYANYVNGHEFPRNIQTPTTKLQRRSNHQTPKWDLKPGASLAVGAWDLELY